jgi:cytochrome c oxidase accessory protein FixG
LEKIKSRLIDDAPQPSLYEQAPKIYLRKIKGIYYQIQLYVQLIILIPVFLIPWIYIDGRHAVLFDLPARQFHFFSFTFWPQDFILLSWALIFFAFLLFFVTSIFGRIWCGYGCPQTLWTLLFESITSFVEGSRQQQIKLDQSPWTFKKVASKTYKHVLWIMISLLTGITFISYFYGIQELLADMYLLNINIMSLSWVIFFSAATYINAGLMKEQVCKYMCPYARFQSAMFDRDTLVVSYNQFRGEPRGGRKKTNLKIKNLGDCLDCTLCVQVCPAGIDIRDGLQYECINCARCIDACNSIMQRMSYPKNLISYTTLNIMEGKPMSWLRLKPIGYAVALIVMTGSITSAFLMRSTFDLNVMRDRGQLFHELPNDFIQNTYQIKLLNKSRDSISVDLSIAGLKNYQIKPENLFFIPPDSIQEVAVDIIVNSTDLPKDINEISILASSQGKIIAEHPSRYIGNSPISNNE